MVIPRLGADCLRVTHPCATFHQVQAPGFSFDLHVLSPPPAFVLSQDQTLRSRENDLLFGHKTESGIELPYPLGYSLLLSLFVWSAEALRVDLFSSARLGAAEAASGAADEGSLCFQSLKEHRGATTPLSQRCPQCVLPNYGARRRASSASFSLLFRSDYPASAEIRSPAPHVVRGNPWYGKGPGGSKCRSRVHEPFAPAACSRSDPHNIR